MAHAGGRPPLYTDVEQLSAIVDEYFATCDNRIQQVYSKKSDGVIEVINPEPYTMAGLAYALGMDRRTLLEYSKTDQFSPTIKAARNRVQLDVERRLMEGNSTGAIFNLKNNFGYVDKTEVDQNVSGELQTARGLSDNELNAIIDADYTKRHQSNNGEAGVASAQS